METLLLSLSGLIGAGGVYLLMDALAARRAALHVIRTQMYGDRPITPPKALRERESALTAGLQLSRHLLQMLVHNPERANAVLAGRAVEVEDLVHDHECLAAWIERAYQQLHSDSEPEVLSGAQMLRFYVPADAIDTDLSEVEDRWRGNPRVIRYLAATWGGMDEQCSA